MSKAEKYLELTKECRRRPASHRAGIEARARRVYRSLSREERAEVEREFFGEAR